MPRKLKQPTQQPADKPTKTRARTHKQGQGTRDKGSGSLDEIATINKSKIQNPKSKIVTPLTPEQSSLIADFRTRYAFPLDPFQEEAIGRLAIDESVMVAAPTG